MKVTPLAIPDVLLIEPRVFGDSRGFFFEMFHAQRYRDAGVQGEFVQDNLSLSRRGTLRGLHAQHPHGQGKLVQVITGAVYDVAVDARVGSPTFGQWVGAELSEDNRHQLWVPAGFLHGFCVTSEQALFCYKCTDLYSPEDEFGVHYDDPALGIEWPIDEPILSERDTQHPLLADIPKERLPRFG